MKARAWIPLVLLVLGAGAARAADEVTENDASDWGKTIETALAARDPKALDDGLDAEALAVRSVGGVDPSAVKSFTKSIREKFKPGTAACEILGKTGTVKFLHVRARSGEYTKIIFRVVGAQGLTYLEYVLRKRDGGPSVIDVTNYVAGEPMSASYRRAFLPLMAAEKEKAKSNLTPEEKDSIAGAAKYGEFGAHSGKGEWKELIEAYAQLPESLRRLPSSLILRSRAAVALKDPKAIATADGDMERYCGSNPLMALSLIDPRVRRKDLKGALAAIASLDEAVGGDTYLSLFRGRVAYTLNDDKAAKEFVATYVKAEPNDRGGYSFQLDVSVRSKDWPVTLAGLRALEKLGVKFKDLRTASAFAEFVKSKEFEAWDADHPTKK